MRISVRFASILALLAFNTIFATTAKAQTWALTLGGSWNSAANWGGTVPNSATAAAIMGGTTAQTVTLDTNITVNSISFTNTALAYTINSGTPTTSTLTLAGTNPFIDVSTAAVTNTINGILAGSTAWTKSGAGVLALTGTANTFSGNLTISGGTLSFNQSGAFSAAGTNSITLAGGTLQGTLATAGATFITATHKIIVNGTGTINVSNSAAILTYGGAAGDISPLTAGTGTLTKSGAGTFRLNASSTNTVQKLVVTGGLWQGPVDAVFGAVPAAVLADAITLNGGGISSNAGFSLSTNRGITLAGAGTINTSSALTVGSIITGGGTLTKTGASSLTLSAANTYTAATTISAGNVIISNNASLGTAAGATTVASGAALQTATSLTGVTEPLTLNGTGISNAGALRITANNPTFSGAITLGSTGVRINSDAGTTTMGGAVGGATFGLTYGGAGNINVTGVIGTTTGTLTKDGAGTVTLSGANTYTGSTTSSGGTLVFSKQVALYNNTPANWTEAKIIAQSGGTMSFVVGGTGEFTATDVAALSALGSATGGFLTGSAFALDTRSLTGVAAGFVYTGNFTDTNSGANVFSLTKNSTGFAVLSGTNTYTGATTINGGTLQFAKQVSLYNNTVASWNPGNIVVNSGATMAFNVGGTGEFTESDITTLTNQGTAIGGFKAGSNVGLDTTNAGGTFAYNPLLTNPNSGANALGLTKLGTGTLVLVAANTYSGGTTVLGGTLLTSTNDGIGSGSITFGDIGGAAGTLDLSSFNQTSTSLTVNTSSNTNFNTINLTAGKTLTLSGNVVVGPAAPLATQISKLTISGGGSLVVTTAAGGLFQVGGSTSTVTGGAGNNAILDLTGLASANINVSITGTVRVNNPQAGNTVGVLATLLMPTPAVVAGTPVATVTAANLNVGDNSGNQGDIGQINSLTLGTGLTTLNVNTVNVGTGARDIGQITFAAGNGTLVLRAADGTSAAAFNVGTGTSNTGVAPGPGLFNNVDFTGHSADLLITTLTIGSQNRNTDRTDVFAFNTGTLNATGVVVGTMNGTANTTAANNTWTSNLNIAGGTVTIGTGGLDIAARAGVVVTGTDVLVGNVNISGGNIAIANSATLGAAIRISTNGVATGLTSTGALNVTGGTLTLAGNIIKGATTGAGTGTVTLDGGTLDLSGNNIGSASPGLLTFNMRSGTLQNLGQFNGGAALVKNTGTLSNTLTLAGTNSFTGVLTINDGNVAIGSATALPAANVVTFGAAAANTAKLQLNGFNQTLSSLTTNAIPGSPIVESGAATAGTDTLTVNTATNNTFAGVFQNGGVRTLSLTKDGIGTLTVGSVAGLQTYTGTTSVLGGTLKLASAITGTSVINVSNGSTLDFNNGTGNQLTSLNTFNLGASGGANLTLQLGSILNSDTLQTPNAVSVVGNILFTIRALPGLGLNTYTLLSSTVGGLTSNSPTYLTPVLPSGFTGTLSTTDTAVTLTINSLPPPGNLYWTGGTDTKWTTVGNFTTDLLGTVPSANVPGPSTSVIYSSKTATNATTAVTTLEADALINDLVFNTETASNTITSIAINPGTIATSTLTIAPIASTVGITVQAGAPGIITIAAPLNVSAVQTWSVADATTTLTLSGAVNLANAVTVSGAGNTTVSGVISGNGALTKIDAGTLTLSASNSAYSGGVVITGGTVTATAPTALGTGNISITNATVNANATSAIGNGAISVNSGGLLKAGATNAFGTGAVGVSAGGTVDLNGSNLGAQVFSIAGTGIGGTGALINTGAGQNNALRFLTLTADASLGGATLTTNRFDIRANPTATLNFGGFTLTKIGGNDIHIVGTTVSNPGNINIQSGQISIETTTNLLGTSANKITVASGANLQLFQNAQNNAWSVDLNDSSVFTNNNGTSNWAGPITILGTSASIATIDANGTAFTLSGNISGPGGIKKTGTLVLTLTGNNSNASTELVAGTLNINSTSAIGSGPLTISGASTINNSTAADIVYGANIVQNWNADFTFTGTKSLNLGTGTVTINGNRTITLSANVFSVGGIAESPVFSGFILTKAGTGTLAINGTSTYTGGTIVSGASRITLGAVNAVGTGPLTLNAATTLNATTNLSGTNALPNTLTLGANLTLDGTQSITFTNSTTVSGAARTLTNNITSLAVLTLGDVNLSEAGAAAVRVLTITGTGVTTTVVSGVIANGGFASTVNNITIGGNNPVAPIVQFTNASNTFTGGVSISSGALYIYNSNGLGVGPKIITMTNGTNGSPELHLDGSSGNITLASNISFTTSTNVTTGGIYNDAGDNTIAGNFSLTSGGGATVLGSNGGTITFSGTIAPTATSRQLNLRGNSNGFITGVIANGSTVNMPVVKDTGTGSWTLSGPNTYSGTTSLFSGGLIIPADVAVSTDGPFGNAATAVIMGDIATNNANSTSMLMNGPFTMARGVTVQTGSATVNTSGNVSLGGTNPTGTATFSGAVTIGNTANAQNKIVNLTAASGGTVSFTGNITLAAGYMGIASLTKIGQGDVILAGTNSYNGTTTVSTGVLRVNGINTAATGAVAVDAGTLRGTGTVGGTTTINTGATIIGGNNPVGTLTLANGLNVTSGGIFAINLVDGTIPAEFGTGGSTLGAVLNPTSNSLLSIIGGTTTFDANALYTFDATGVSFNNTVRYSYRIASGAGDQSALNVAATNITPIGLDNPMLLNITGDSSGAVYLNFQIIPEPSFLLGLAGIIGFVRLRRKA